MFNKKGQQEVSMGTVLLIIIGVIAVVLIVVSVTGGFDYLTGLFEKKTGDLTVFTGACTTYSQSELYNDYCREFREGEILGVKGFFNCQYEPFEADIKKDATTLDCARYDGYGTADSSAEKYCVQVKDEEGVEFNEDMKVNGESCQDRKVVATTNKVTKIADGQACVPGDTVNICTSPATCKVVTGSPNTYSCQQ